MKTLYFIRHAESEANRQRIMASRLSFPLTPEGKSDSLKIASELRSSAEIDRIISSPLKRAVQTAESFSGIYNLEVQLDERLAEQHMGIYSGMGYDDVKNQMRYEQDPLKRWNWVPDGGGESYSMIAERVQSFLADIETIGDAENILIVTHAVALRLIIASLENTLPSYPKEFPNNGEILRVEFSGLGIQHEINSIFLGNSKSFIHNP